MMNRTLQRAKYIILDFLSAAIAWGAFFVYRKLEIEQVAFSLDRAFYLGLMLIPTYWVLLYSIAGYYRKVYRKNRLRELSQTLLFTSIGVLVLFFSLLLDDEVQSYKNYYSNFMTLFWMHFSVTFLFRVILTSITVKRIHRREIGYNTLLVGGNEKAWGIYDEINNLKNSPGYKFIGFVGISDTSEYVMSGHLPLLGGVEDIRALIESQQVEEVIIAAESSEHAFVERIINSVEGTNVYIKVIPDMYDILTGSVKMTSIFGAPLIEIDPLIMPDWQRSLKRIMDVGLSVVALLLLVPVFIVLAVAIKMTSKGPIFFKQERIGIYGAPFFIYKFRSMVVDAEKDGPKLSSSNDSRITKIGKFMRKTRLDELPQFWNVLIGDMSLVGPRPERQFFIDQIVQVAPHYYHLQKVRPGITSWGQVKYGYAENVDQMVARLKYDILYIENMSIALDIKIMIYTVLIVFKGSGK